ncbi:MAG: hypothetical protein CSA21_01135 [Deltaproteobacteria bacterium]|nr:MAG: hypothetical protein CSA21_01135 [Deltaproteobacteria bacterium]
MDSIVKVLTHARRLNSATKKLSVQELYGIKEKLEKIIEQRLEAEQEALKKDAEKIEKIKQYKEMLAKDGINPGDLLTENGEKGGRKRAPRPPKYKITDDSGKTRTWTGQGRMPNVFKEKVDAGIAIETFLIK